MLTWTDFDVEAQHDTIPLRNWSVSRELDQLVTTNQLNVLKNLLGKTTRNYRCSLISLGVIQKQFPPTKLGSICFSVWKIFPVYHCDPIAVPLSYTTKLYHSYTPKFVHSFHGKRWYQAAKFSKTQPHQPLLTCRNGGVAGYSIHQVHREETQGPPPRTSQGGSQKGLEVPRDMAKNPRDPTKYM